MGMFEAKREIKILEEKDESRDSVIGGRARRDEEAGKGSRYGSWVMVNDW